MDAMSAWADPRGRRLIALVGVLLAALLAAELYRQLSIRPVRLPTLLFELLEIVLLVGCTVSGTLLILRVRAREMAAATAAMLALLLAGELYLSARPVTTPMLLFELLEAALLVGGAIACALLIRATRRG
jgi:hypothetical protein